MSPTRFGPVELPPSCTSLRTHAFAFGLLLFLFVWGHPLAAQRVSELPAQDRPIVLSATEVYRVGAATGADWEMLTSVTSVAFDESANAYIFDMQNRSLVKVGPNGRFQRQFLRSGGGPGEVTLPGAVGVQRDGTVMVLDRGRQVYTWFAPDGSLLESVPFDMMAGDPTPERGAQALPGGGFASPATAVVGRGGPGGAVLSPPTSTPIYRFQRAAPAQKIFDAWRAPIPEASEAGRPLPGIGGGGGGMMMRMGPMVQRAFDPTVSIGVLPDGRLAVADTITWSIKMVGANGRVESVLHRPIRPRRVTRQDQEAERARRRAVLEGGAGPQVQIQGPGGGGVGQDQMQAAVRRNLLAQLDALEFADEVPVLQEIRTDWEGRIWALRTGARPGEPGPIDVLSAHGTYLGTIPAGQMDFPVAFGPGGQAAFVELDAFDIPQVVVRRITINQR